MKLGLPRWIVIFGVCRRGVARQLTLIAPGCFAIVTLLVGSCSRSSDQSLFDAVRAKDLAAVSRTLDRGANVNAVGDVKLPEHGGSIKDHLGVTPLYCAVFLNQKEIVQLLIEKGADVERKTSEGTSALYRGCLNGNLEIAQLLLEHGASVDSSNNEGTTPLGAAASNGNLRLVAKLLEHGASVNARNSRGWTPLFFALWGERSSRLQGATATAIRRDFAHSQDRSGLVKVLVDAGASVDSEDNVGTTALIQAVILNDVASAKVLLDHGANPQIALKLGPRLPVPAGSTELIEIAKSAHNEGLVNLLKKYGSKK